MSDVVYTERDILRAYVAGRPLTEEEQRDMIASLDALDSPVPDDASGLTDDSADGKE